MQLSYLPLTLALTLGLVAFAVDAPAQEIVTAYQPDAPLLELKTFQFFKQ